jgi:hypothetical protein
MDEYIKQISNTELNITKNILLYIKDPIKYKFIKDNVILLGFNNKLGKNSLNILLENKEYDIIKDLIKTNYKILNFKNLLEKNFLQSLLLIDILNTYVLELLQYLFVKNKNFFNKIILHLDMTNTDFIDILIILINKNNNSNNNLNNNIDDKYNFIKPLLSILKFLSEINLYSQLIINKLSNKINDDDFLLYILKKLNINNIEITQTINNHLCIDILFYNNHMKSFEYLISNANIINFKNIDDNIIFNLVNSLNKDVPKLIVELINKSNLLELRDVNNNNIILLFIKKFNIGYELIINLLNNVNNKYLIFEKNIDDVSIFDLIKNNYIFKKLNINYFKNKKFNFLKIKKLICCDINIGTFNADTLHNIIYTYMIISKYKKKLDICYINYDKSKQINELFKLEISNNDMNINELLNLYINNFYSFYCHLVIWKNENSYYINQYLMSYLKDKCIDKYKKRFIYIKLSIVIADKNIRHANIIIIDNKYKLVERFEPYGDMYNESIIGLDNLIKIKIADVINYKYNIIQTYPGYQTKTIEYNNNFKSYGDPTGYCLAWCFLFLEARLLYDNLNSKEVVELINIYIIKNFELDFKDILNDNQLNKFMVFIRHYGKSLDNYKNKLMIKFNISLKTIYHINLKDNIYNEICYKLNKNLQKILN